MKSFLEQLISTISYARLGLQLGRVAEGETAKSAISVFGTSKSPRCSIIIAIHLRAAPPNVVQAVNALELEVMRWGEEMEQTGKARQESWNRREQN